MRLFELVRTIDHTGVSGTGVVAQGVVFDDNTVAMRWLGQSSSTVIHDSIENVIKIHDHQGTKSQGGTAVRWL